MAGRREAIAEDTANPVDSLLDRKAGTVANLAQRMRGSAREAFDQANAPEDVQGVTGPVFKVHYSRPGMSRGRGNVYLYGPRTESAARETAQARLPEDISILFVETLTLEAARLGLRFGLSLRDVLRPDDYKTMLCDLARVKADAGQR